MRPLQVATVVSVVVAATTTALLVASVVSSAGAASDDNPDSEQAQEARALPSLAIVFPKRSSLINGLNQQFKLRQPAAQEQSNKTAPLFGANLAWLSSRPAAAAAASSTQQRPATRQPHAALDRKQQQLLASKPNLLASTLLTRPSDSSSANHQQQQPRNSSQLLAQQPQQLYRGYSLIELEVRSDSDRRYVQELYGNLSAALDEQAQNPNSPTVSPYVDVDFWSFKSALNDQIDIMVSPKSRAFILGQLSRARIRHQIKIDDIQARLDQQQQQLASGSTSALVQQPASLGKVASTASTAAAATATANGASGTPVEGLLSGRHGQAANSRPSLATSSANQQQPSWPSDSMNGRQALHEGESSGPAPRTLNESQFFDNYQRLAEINQYLEGIVEQSREVARVKVIGRSSQGRYLRVLKLGYEQQDVDGSTRHSGSGGDHQVSSGSPVNLNNATNILEAFLRRQESTPKLGSIWLDGGTHAREWISPATVLYIAFRLSDNHAKCVKFLDTMKFLVTQQQLQQQQSLQSQQQQRRARRSVATPPVMQPTLDANLLTGINEINTSLLGKPTQLGRQRTELERMLETLAKNPQEVAGEHQCDLKLEQLLRRYTFYIMPVLNPDGYEYSHTHNRLWRKTRSTSNHPIFRHFCLGADPNRNYDARHGQTGSSTHPCSQTYAGAVPFTEPETKHQSNFVYANRIGMKMFISFHSYSQMILLPYSHSQQLAPDHKDLESVGLAGVKAIEQTHGTLYRVGPSASVLYTASGTASDWAYEKAGIKYSYTIELRDTGTYGFLLPRQQIIPTGEETFNGLLAMIDQMEKNDHLLTSKSSLLSGAGVGVASSSSSSSSPNNILQNNGVRGISSIVAPVAVNDFLDYNHVPAELDHLKPFAKQRVSTRPPLENILDGSHQPADSANYLNEGLSSSGARDRRPSNGAEYSASSSVSRLDNEEPASNDSEPDAGYAFEGEGELMEPSAGLELTGNFEAPAARASANARLSGRQDHSGRITQLAGLTASGRSFINSPLQQPQNQQVMKFTPARESSNRLAPDGRRTKEV